VRITSTRGIGRYVADLARGIARRARAADDRPSVRVVERLGFGTPSTVSSDVEGAVARLQAGDRTLTHMQWAYRVRFRLAAAARESGADLVHSPDPNATPLGRMRCPRIVTCHDLINLAFPEHYLGWRDGWSPGRRWLDGRRYSRADHVIAVSETTANDLVATLGIDARRISVVPNGIDLSRFSPAPQPKDAEVRARHGLTGGPYLLYVGAADWRKNPDGMLGALEILWRRGGDQPPLVWAGRLGKRDLALIHRLAAERGIQPGALKLIGWVPDEEVTALMRGALALLFVSRLEGFGYPIVEAMAAGCPVIAADRPATVEMAGDAAVLVDPERPQAIADAASALMRDSAERRRLAELGLARSKVFDAGRMADETLAVYRQVSHAAGHHPRRAVAEGP
jgi:glycosyltransferase involved in cell wall biosynthesis